MIAPWYVLHSQPRKEGFLLDQLRLNGFEAYCPFMRVKPVNPRSRKNRPYFPGYVFVRVDLSQASASSLQWIPGATGFVSFDGIPAHVPDELIPRLRQRMETVNATGGGTRLEVQPGDSVRVTEGPFAGYEAVFDSRLPDAQRVRVLLKLIQQRRQVPVDLPAASIQPQRKR
jgi:transcriptional antiterminator RfaH